DLRPPDWLDGAPGAFDGVEGRRLPSHDCSSRRPVGGLLERGSVAILQPGKACWSRTAISFSASGTGSGWSIPKRKAPDEVE
ncbi:MAG TPA: hypothetical protein VFF94_15510, partial [Novosphingobium sp.]|nr:hypothetical protein [Novosphingobium sp.]